MYASSRTVLVLALPLLLGMRDPFRPPEDPCAVAALSRWHYHGVIVSQGRQIGLLRDSDGGGWLRVQASTQLPGGGQVLQLTEQELLTATGSGCDPTHQRWPREGLKK